MIAIGVTRYVRCSVDGCVGNSHPSAFGAREWCCAHYRRWRRHGDPLAGRTPEGDPIAFLERSLADETDECIPWPFSRNSHGRALVWIDGRAHLAARVACNLAHGAPPKPTDQAAHSCGKGHEGCINPRHLRWATRSENESDKLIHGTHNRGERQGSAKLTEADVLDIRRRAADGETQLALARRYNVSRQAIYKIVQRKNWGWLT